MSSSSERSTFSRSSDGSGWSSPSSDLGHSSGSASSSGSGGHFHSFTAEVEFWIEHVAQQMAAVAIQDPKLIAIYCQESAQSPSSLNSDEVVGMRPIRAAPLTAKKRSPNKKPVKDFCAFCKNNNEEAECLWKNHRLHDENGDTVCPVLCSYVCPYCGASGSKAHTIRYCATKKERELKKLELAFKAKKALFKDS